MTVILVCNQGISRVQELCIRHDLEKQSQGNSGLLPQAKGQPNPAALHPPARSLRAMLLPIWGRCSYIRVPASIPGVCSCASLPVLEDSWPWPTGSEAGLGVESPGETAGSPTASSGHVWCILRHGPASDRCVAGSQCCVLDSCMRHLSA